ncbi:MAG: hypothetical protein OEZ10_10820 [Gammaproteobacteria bacterium]|nr:hypothetical protein [Gammaproteobacteria bacterium]
MNRNNIATLLLPGLLLSFPTYGQDAQENADAWFFSSPLSWNLSLDYDGRWNTTETSPGTHSDTSTERWATKLTFKKRFALLDPKIASFAVSAKPVFIQQSTYTDVSGQTLETESTAWDYSAAMNLLQGARVPFSIAASTSQSSGYTEAELGGETEFINDQKSVTLNLKNRWLPSYISYSRSYSDLLTTSTLAGADWHNEYEVETTGFYSRSSKLSFSLVNTDYTDLLVPLHDYNSKRGWLNHTLGWGKGSHLQTFGDAVEQTGFGAYDRKSLSENLRLQHTQRFRTDIRYGYNESTQVGTSIGQTGQIDFFHELYANLDTNLGYVYKSTEFDLGREASAGPRYSVSYVKTIPWHGATISMAVNGAQLDTDREAQSQLLSIIDEAHTTDITGIITLNQPYVDTASIVITDIIGTPYILGTHYTVATVANITEIQVIDTVVIPTGTTVYVDYNYQTPPAMDYTSKTNGGNINFRVKGVRLYYRYASSNTEVSTGAGSNFIADSEDQSTGIEYSGGFKGILLSTGYHYKDSVVGDYETETTNLYQSASANITSLISIQESVNVGRSNTTLSDVDNSGAKLMANFNIPWFGLTINSHVNYWRRDDSLGNNDRFLSHGARVNWRFFLVQLSAGLTFSDWDGTSRNTEETRFMVTLTRNSQ